MYHLDRIRDEETCDVSLDTHAYAFLDDSGDDMDSITKDDPKSSLRSSNDFDELAARGNANRLRHGASESSSSCPIRAWSAVKNWVKGPEPPRIYRIKPLLPKIQHAPIVAVDRFAPKRSQRIKLLVLIYVCWLSIFFTFLWRSSLAEDIPGHGSPVRINCLDKLWNDEDECGLAGEQCKYFRNASFAFRCPASCHKAQVVYPHTVGDQEIVYKPLVIGGFSNQTPAGTQLVDDAVYRGDSFVCASAVHAGFIEDSRGGCGVMTLTGERSLFAGIVRHGIESAGFDSYFPQNFAFLRGTNGQCQDLRWLALVPSVFFTVLLSLFTTDPGVQFWSIFVALFFHTAIVSDPPGNADYYSLFSTAFGRFLPACFCAWVTYRYTVKRSLTGLTAQVEKTVLWLGPAWVGALNDYTFDQIPIQRLTPHDLKAQPGAVPALIIIVFIIVSIAIGQAWAFRVEGRMPRYLAIYGLFVIGLVVMAILPGLNLRLHHYIHALMLLPGTSFQSRRSLIYQGLLLGLFINGVARWGFASILETPAALLTGAPQDTLIPTVSVLAIGASNISLKLTSSLPVYDAEKEISYNGLSVLVNDVERFRGYDLNDSVWDSSAGAGESYIWTWTRLSSRSDGTAEEARHNDTHGDTDLQGPAEPLPEYFRFGYVAGGRLGDYSKAAKWLGNGTWVESR